MMALVSVLLVLTISMLVIRIASVALVPLVHTGIGREAARFQSAAKPHRTGFAV